MPLPPSRENGTYSGAAGFPAAVCATQPTRSRSSRARAPGGVRGRGGGQGAELGCREPEYGNQDAQPNQHADHILFCGKSCVPHKNNPDSNRQGIIGFLPHLRKGFRGGSAHY